MARVRRCGPSDSPPPPPPPPPPSPAQTGGRGGEVIRGASHLLAASFRGEQMAAGFGDARARKPYLITFPLPSVRTHSPTQARRHILQSTQAQSTQARMGAWPCPTGLAEARRGADPRLAPRRVAEIGASRLAPRAPRLPHTVYRKQGSRLCRMPTVDHRFCSMILSQLHPAVCTWRCHWLSYLDHTRQQGRARLARLARLRG